MNGIHPTAIIENSEIGDGVTIGPYSVVIDSVVKEGCEIMSHARIRNSKFEKNCRVGGEVSNSHFGENTKKKHEGIASSVTCGKNCMIGGGSVFARYDGKGKGTFELGDNVFVGSNTVISTKANVTRKIGSNVKIGALCHVDKDISDNSLVYIDRNTGQLAIREDYYQ